MADIPVEVKKATPAETAPPDVWRSFRGEMDRLFDRFGFPSLRRMFDIEPAWRPPSTFSFSAPAIDMSEGENAYKITAELPGLETKDVDVSVSGNTLVLKGEKRQEKEEKDKTITSPNVPTDLSGARSNCPQALIATRSPLTIPKGCCRSPCPRRQKRRSKRRRSRSSRPEMEHCSGGTLKPVLPLRTAAGDNHALSRGCRARSSPRTRRSASERIEIDQCSDPFRIAGSASVVEFMTASDRLRPGDRRQGAQPRDAIERLSLRRSAHPEVEEKIPMNARDVMSKPVVTVRPDAPLREIARLLLDKKISAVPVVDDNGAPIGMVSEGDLIRPERASREAWRQSWLEIFAEGESLAPELLAWLESQNQRARAVMSAPAVTVSEDAELGEIARVLVAHRIKRVPVVRDGRITGIVARDDLLRALSLSKPDL